MVNDLKELMRENVAAPPPDHLDLTSLVVAGRRRVRRRRFGVVGGVCVAVAGVVLGAAVALPHGNDRAGVSDRPPAPDAPTVDLSKAGDAVEGRDYRVLASYTNENLDRDNGQYFDGVTDDGLILFRDGPRSDQLYARLALMDPATEEKDWLPDPPSGQNQTWPVDLGADRLVLVGGTGGGMKTHMAAYVFDRTARQWSTVQWPTLPKLGFFPTASLGPDGRLYAFVQAKRIQVPEGGWPTGPDGEADDSGADGEKYHLWSVSLTDPGDVRDEGLTVGSLAFTDTSMVWTDSTNGDAGLVHVRDLATGEEHSFDPHTGEKCNLLSFGVTGDLVMMSQYCGDYGSVRDDRVQLLTTDGDQVVTLQDSGVEGVVQGDGDGVVTVTSYGNRPGSYVYDPEAGDFLRLSTGVSKFSLGGSTPDGLFLWDVPVNKGHGATQLLGELLP